MEPRFPEIIVVLPRQINRRSQFECSDPAATHKGYAESEP